MYSINVEVCVCVCVCVSSMRVVQCSMPDPTLVFVEGTGVSVEVTQLTLAINGRWATKFGIM